MKMFSDEYPLHIAISDPYPHDNINVIIIKINLPQYHPTLSTHLGDVSSSLSAVMR